MNRLLSKSGDKACTLFSSLLIYSVAPLILWYSCVQSSVNYNKRADSFMSAKLTAITDNLAGKLGYTDTDTPHLGRPCMTLATKT